MRLARPFVRAVVFAGAAWTVCPPAAAQTRRENMAETLFQQGREAMDRGDYATACHKLAESHRIDPAPGTLLNLAVCHEKAGKIATAVRRYRELAEDRERGAFAAERVAALEKRMPRLTLRLAAGAPPGTEVRIEGQPVPPGRLGAATAVDPGEVNVVVTAPGRREWRTSIGMREGEARDMAVAPGPPEGTAAAAPGAPDAPAGTVAATGPGGGTRTAGWIALGVGAAALGASAVTGLLAIDKKKAMDASCHGTSVCDGDDGVRASDDGRKLSTASTVAFGVGIAGVGVGTVLLIAGRTGPDPGVAAAPAAVPGGGAIVVRGRF